MASGDTLLTWRATDNEQPAASAAAFDTRNAHPCLDFDDTSDESAVFSGVLPRHYGGGGITAYHHYAMLSATTGKVRIEGSFERIGDGSQDIDADGFAAAQGVNVAAVDGTSGNIDVAAVAFTNGAQMDSVAVGESFRYKVQRKPSDTTNDTAAGDLQLTKVELKET